MRLALLSALLAISSNVALPAEEQTQTYEDAIVAAPLPEGYRISSKDLLIAGEDRGKLIVVSKEGVIGKVIITIERRDLPTNDQKRTAFKAMVNGSSNALSRAGLKRVGKISPDLDVLEQHDYSKPLTVNLEYEDKDGKPVYQELRGFFSKLGYSVVVIARDKDELHRLSEWAKTVNEK